MPRKRILRTNQFLYHVTNRSNNKEWFYIPIETAWDIFCKILTYSSNLYETEIHAFVLMSNHYHLLISTPKSNLDIFMRHFQTEVCREIQRIASRVNHVFGNRYKWSVLDSSYAVAYVYKYVIRNPVRAGIVSRIEEYPFCLFSEIYRGGSSVPHTERLGREWRFIPKNLGDRLEWLNHPTPKEREELISKALRRSTFKFSQGNEMRESLSQLYHDYGIYPVPDTFSAEK